MKRLAATFAFIWLLTLLGPGSACAQSATQPWSLGIAGGSFFENNAAGDERQSDFGGTLGINLGRSLSFGPRGSLSLSGNANKYLHRDLANLDHLAYGVGVNGTYQITRRLTWGLSDSVSSSYGQNNKLLIDEGIVLPNVEAISHGLSMHLGYLLSPRMDVNATISSQSVGFDTSVFTGGSNLSAALALSRKINASQQLGISYDFARTFSDSGTGAIQGLVGTWQMTRGRSSTNATGGVRLYTQPGGGSYDYTPSGSFGWSWLLSETHTIALAYSDSVSQGFGFDRTQLTQNASGTYTLTHRRVSIGFGGTYSRNTYPLVEEDVIIGEATSATIRYLVNPKFSVVLDSSIYSTRQGSGPWISSYRTTMSLSYATSFR